MLLLYVFIFLTSLVLFGLYKLSVKRSVFDKIPGPPGVPILGNALDVLKDRVTIFHQARKWAKTYKDMYLIWMPPFASLNVYSPDIIETVTSNSQHNEKSFLYEYLKPWLNEGLLLSTGSKWHSRRKILTPAFHFNILKHFSEIIEENSWKFIKRLDKEIGQDKTNIVPLLSMYTLDSICETAMGYKIDEDDTGSGAQYKKAIHDMGQHLVNRMTRIWLRFEYIFNLTKCGQDQKETLKIIRKFPKRVINERREYRDMTGNKIDLELLDNKDDSDLHMNRKRKKMAMLDLLLTAEKDQLIDEKGIQEEVDTFMFEGHDTVSVGLTFALMVLANNKDVQEKILEESRSIFGDSSRAATMNDLLEMKYLDCCVKESLRLFPPVPFIGRVLGEPLNIGETTLAAGTLFHIHIFDLHRRPDLFEDPLHFNPDRFLPENSMKRHPYSFIPFSAGARNCIGQRFAMLEMKSAISAIIRKFELEPVTKPDEIEFSADLVLRANSPIYVKFVKRNT